MLDLALHFGECITDSESCHRSGFCVTRDVWVNLNEKIIEMLQAVTLQEMVERKKEIRNANVGLYQV